jgi:sialic acid synthase SpsE
MLREIAGRPIGPGHRVFVIAEIGLNHSGSLDRALEMVDAAAWAGASAIKLQTLEADRLVAGSCPAPAHVRAGSLRDFFARFELDAAAHRAIAERARERGLAMMATPFAESLVAMLEALPVDAYKIASGDLTYHGLIESAAATGRPIVISTGMGTLAEVGRAVEAARAAGAGGIAALHCVSAYPAPVESQNLRAIVTLERHLRIPVGLSDHAPGSHAAVAAVALGACLYERHLVLEGDAAAVDHAVSSTPAQLRNLVELLDDVRRALGDGRKICQPAERPNLIPSRRALYAARPLRAGTRVTREDIAVLRPAAGLPPSELTRLVGSVIDRDLPAGAAFTAADLMLERAS